MGVEQERVQLEILDQVTEPLVEEAHVVTFAHDPCDVCRLDAGGDEEDAPSVGVRWRHVVGGLVGGGVGPPAGGGGRVGGWLLEGVRKTRPPLEFGGVTSWAACSMEQLPHR